ncbi:hypothetical protein PENSPDRAFT_672691 [Peniophora sp. CONT]|nr:hypothetical protein PENSPDRAFT_672691 [Peniophora sp. CONT]
MPHDNKGKGRASSGKPYIRTEPYRLPNQDDIIDLTNDGWSPEAMPRAKISPQDIAGQSSKSRLPMATREDEKNPNLVVVQEWGEGILLKELQKRKDEIAHHKRLAWAAGENLNTQKKLTADADRRLKDLKDTIETKNVMDGRKIARILECPLCLEVYTAPWTLGCGHTFCQKCLQDSFKDVQHKYRASNPGRLDKYNPNSKSHNSVSFRCPFNREHWKEHLKGPPAPAYAIKELCDEIRGEQDKYFLPEEAYTDPVATWSAFFLGHA